MIRGSLYCILREDLIFELHLPAELIHQPVLLVTPVEGHDLSVKGQMSLHYDP